MLLIINNIKFALSASFAFKKTFKTAAFLLMFMEES